MLSQVNTIDPSAEAFIIAAGITDPTQEQAINTLVVNLKKASLWNLMYAIYPFVGGTESCHKYNLINPSDANAAYRLSFVGGWVHDSSGITPNGTNGYANTFLNGADLPSNSFNFSFYNRTNVTEDRYDMGCQVDATSLQRLQISYPTNITIVDAYDTVDQAGRAQSDNGGNTGYFIVSRESDSVMKVYKNSTMLRTTNLSLIGTQPSLDIFISALNLNLTPFGFSTKNCALVTIGSSLLSTANILSLNTIVQEYQTTLGRNV